jgi:glycine/D-amino acid oxidase-like deaminating enzyme
MDELLGQETGFHTCGIMYVCDTAAELRTYESWLQQARQYQVSSRILTRREVESVAPGLQRPIAAALYTPDDGRAEPARAAPAIARALLAEDGIVLTGCAVRAVERTAGRVSGVLTEKGRIAASAVVLAGGAWSRLFCGNMGVDLPQLKVLGSVMRTEPIEGGPTISAAGSDFAYRKREDGGYTVAHGGLSTFDITPDSFRLLRLFLLALKLRSVRLRLSERFFAEWREPRRWAADEATPFERVRVLDPDPDAQLLNEAFAAFKAVHPAFAGAREAARWAGLIDVTPDAVPVISGVDGVPGFYIATGFSGHGFGIGPGAGRLMADIVAGDAPIVDPSPFRFSRFSDGTPIRIDAGF